MGAEMTLNLLATLGGLLGFVAWIGWRCFLTPARSSHVASQPNGESVMEPRILERAIRSDGDDWMPAATQKIARKFALLAHRSVLASLVLVGAVVGSVFAMSGRIALEPLAALDLGRLEHIQSALHRENLVPLPPLPPSVFIGTDRPGLESADRDWSRLSPDFARLALTVFAKAEARGYPLVLLEGYRSPKRQDELADAAVQVTNARAYQSKHQYGLALDAAPMKDGRLIISERDPWAMEAYRVLGEEAEKAGLVWGGRWRLKDFGHIEASQSVSTPARGTMAAGRE